MEAVSLDSSRVNVRKAESDKIRQEKCKAEVLGRVVFVGQHKEESRQ